MNDFEQSSRFIEVEDHDVQSVFGAERERRRIHDCQFPGENLIEPDCFEPGRRGIFFRICGINAVDLGCFEKSLRFHFKRAERGGRVGREIRRPGSAGENHEFAGGKLTERLIAVVTGDERLHSDRECRTQSTLAAVNAFFRQSAFMAVASIPI